MKKLLVLALLLLVIAVPAQATQRRIVVATIGAVGCSNTRQAVEGYGTVSTQDKFWRAQDIQGYGGKTMIDWANPASPAWRTFDKALQLYPNTTTIWWQLCLKPFETASNATADAIYNLIRQRTNAPIYASPLDASPTCMSDDVEAQGYVDYLVNAGKVLRGPILTPLNASQLQSDGCHANAQGMLVWGADLVEFFDGG